MAEQVVLNANNRDSEGKSSNRQLRRAGSVPAVIYGGEQEPIRISILEKDIAKASEVTGFTTQILNVTTKVIVSQRNEFSMLIFKELILILRSALLFQLDSPMKTNA